MQQPRPTAQVTTTMTETQETPKAFGRRRVRIAQAESDLAYFQARLALIGQPLRLKQYAQQRAFEILNEAVGQKLSKLSGDRA